MTRDEAQQLKVGDKVYAKTAGFPTRTLTVIFKDQSGLVLQPNNAASTTTIYHSLKDICGMRSWTLCKPYVLFDETIPESVVAANSTSLRIQELESGYFRCCFVNAAGEGPSAVFSEQHLRNRIALYTRALEHIKTRPNPSQHQPEPDPYKE
jgi:hypothetical protein